MEAVSNWNVIKIVKDLNWDGKLESVSEGHENDEIRIWGRE